MTDNSALSMIDPNIPIKKFATPVIQTGTTTRMDFDATPLPSSWILGGNPSARSIPLGRAEDGNLSYGLWDCQAGKFKFIYSCDELVYILFIDRVYFKLKKLLKKVLGKA